MSRNFELLHHLARAEELFDVRLPDPASATSNGKPHKTTVARTNSSPEIDGLVQRLFLVPAPVRTLAFVAAEAGHKPDFVCARSGETLAVQLGASVCVLDANFGRPSAHRYFDVRNDGGMAEALTAGKPFHKYAQKTSIENLSVITAGSAVADLPPLLQPHGLPAKMLELRSHFDFVLIDTEPIQSNPTAVSLSRLADGAILIVEADTTRCNTALNAKKELELANAKLIGAVLNNRKFPIPKLLYSLL
jgi:Mrp family chromosome partitioning ATPase